MPHIQIEHGNNERELVQQMAKVVSKALLIKYNPRTLLKTVLLDSFEEDVLMPGAFIINGQSSCLVSPCLYWM